MLGLGIEKSVSITLYCFSMGVYILAFMTSLFIGVVKDRRILLLLILIVIFWHTIVPQAVTEELQ